MMQRPSQTLAAILICSGLLLPGCGPQTPAGPNKRDDSTTPAADQGDSADGAQAAAPGASAAGPQSRHFKFTYAAGIQDLPEDAEVRVWIPVPQDTTVQRIKVVDQQFPTETATKTEPKYGNKMLSFACRGRASVDFSITYDAARQEVLTSQGTHDNLTEEQRQLFLQANKLVPTSDETCLALLDGLEAGESPWDLGRALYHRVEDHMQYDKPDGKPWGRGDAVWACQNQFGNCTDFHSLFIALARAKGLPAKFEIGFPLPPERGEGTIGGYHCWAYFYVDGQGWIPVDISEADKHPDLKEYYFSNLSKDRLAFSSGRDLNLVPQQQGDPLNFFVYPYVEVDGQPWPREKIKLQFRYQDLP